MKKLFMLLFMFLSLSLFSKESKERERHVDFKILNELKDLGYTILPEIHVIAYRNDQDTIKKKTNYEKYWEQKEGIQLDKPFRHKDNKDTLKKDTLKQIVIIENNYFDEDPFYYTNNIGRFYNRGFNYWMYSNPYFYSNYWMYDYSYNPWVDFYFGYNYNFGYHGYNYGYYGYNYNYGFNTRYNTDLIYNPNNGQPKHYTNIKSKPYYSPQQKNIAQERRQSYTPSYNNSRAPIKARYNNSQVQERSMQRKSVSSTVQQPQRPQQSRTYTPQSRQSNYSQPQMKSSEMNRSYSQPNYSQPSRSNFGNTGNTGMMKSSGSSSGSSNVNTGRRK